MIRYITFSELSSECFHAEVSECNRQIWTDGSKWTGNAKQPRSFDGLSLICSPVEATYSLPDGKLIAAKQGDAVYLPRGSIYTVSFRNGGHAADIYTVNFLITAACGDELRLSRELSVFTGAASPLCQSAASELADAFLFRSSVLRRHALFLKLLDYLSSYFERHSKEYYPIRRGVALLTEEWDKNERISRYAEVCGLGESTFYACFAAWAKKSPVDYRNEIRIAAAKSMLTNSNLPISEIARSVGFDDPYYFSRAFKKAVGVSPRNFRDNPT